jgi:hypothetical protein
MSLQIFECNAGLVSQYTKYRGQLHSVMHKHIENGNIQELEDETFIVINQGAYIHRFDDIENLMLTDRQEKMNGRSQPSKLLPPTTTSATSKSLIEVKQSAVTNKAILVNLDAKENHPPQHHAEKIPDKRQDTGALSTGTDERTATNIFPMCLRSKRKAAEIETISESQTRAQTRRFKRN